MKKSLLSIVVLSGALLSTIALAKPIQLSDCPPPEFISAHGNFTEADKIGNVWGLTTDGYQYNDKTWHTIMDVSDSSYAKTSDEALQKSRVYFAKINLNKPNIEFDAVCVYSKSENYVVGAVPEDVFDDVKIHSLL